MKNFNINKNSKSTGHFPPVFTKQYKLKWYKIIAILYATHATLPILSVDMDVPTPMILMPGVWSRHTPGQSGSYLQSMRSTRAAAKSEIKVKDMSTIARMVRSSDVYKAFMAFHNNAQCRTQAELHSKVREKADVKLGPRNRKCDHGGSQLGCTYPPKPLLVWMLPAEKNFGNF